MTEQNKRIAEEILEEVFNKKSLEATEKYFTKDYVFHGAPPGLPPGLEGVKVYCAAVFAAFPDYHVVSTHTLAEGDLVAQRFVGKGTHTGPFMGIEATGKKVEVSGAVIYRMADGIAVEEWMETDQLTLMQQLGVIPA
jgi:predicted ester cyclase